MEHLEGGGLYEEPIRPLGLRRNIVPLHRRHPADRPTGQIWIRGSRTQLTVLLSCSLAFAVSVLVLAIIFWPQR